MQRQIYISLTIFGRLAGYNLASGNSILMSVSLDKPADTLLSIVLAMKFPPSVLGGAGLSANLIEGAFKLGHFAFFMMVAFVLCLQRVKLRISAILLLVLLVSLAIATEGLQLQLFDRTTRISDILIDVSGICVGWILAGLVSKLFRKKPTEPTIPL